LPGLETLLSDVLITINKGDDFEDFIESLAKLLSVEQLDGNLNQLEVALLNRLFDLFFFGWGLNLWHLRGDDLDLDWDWLTDLTTLWAAETQLVVEDFITWLSGLKHGDWNGNGEALVGFNLLVDWHVDELDWETLLLNRGIHTEEHALLPAPVGAVLDLDIVEDNAAWSDFENNVWVVNNDSALDLVLASATAMTVLLLPVLLHLAPVLLHLAPVLLVPLLVATLLLPVLLHLLPVLLHGGPVVVINTHVAKELAGHLFPELGLFSALLLSPFLALLLPGALMAFWLPLHLELLPGFLHLLPVWLALDLVAFGVLVENREDHGWSSTSLADLQEWVWVLEVFFALGTQVVVLADGTLVADTLDWAHTTAVALDALVNNLLFLGLLLVSSLLDGLLLRLKLFDELVVDTGDGSFELGANQVLDGFAGHVGTAAWALALLALALLAFALLALAEVVRGVVPIIVGRVDTVIHVSLNLWHDNWLLLSNDWLFLDNWWLLNLDWFNLDWLLELLLWDNLLRLGWLVAWQLDEELDLAVSAESSGVGHLQLVVVSDLDLVVVRVAVVNALLLLFWHFGILAHDVALSHQLLEGLGGGDTLNSLLTVGEVKAQLDLQIDSLGLVHCRNLCRRVVGSSFFG